MTNLAGLHEVLRDSDPVRAALMAYDPIPNENPPLPPFSAPEPSGLDDFAASAGRYMSDSRNRRRWVIGNEP